MQNNLCAIKIQYNATCKNKFKQKFKCKESNVSPTQL